MTPSSVRHHDLIVIGAGSGNMMIDESFADLDVAIIERAAFGGTCLNRGCIPSKILSYTADVRDVVATAGRFDVESGTAALDWKALRDRVFGRTDAIAKDGRRGREESDFVTVYAGQARFVGLRRLVVDLPDAGSVNLPDAGGVELTADRIVVAAGGRPSVPPPITETGVPYLTSDTAMRIDAAPARLAVLGGGYVAAELAHVFAAAGSEIVLIDKADTLLDGQDEAITAAFTDLAARRYELHLGREITAAVCTTAGGTVELRLTLDDDTLIEADALLVATGRVPNSDTLDAEAGGLALHDDGRIVVDEHQRTSVDGVFALGDICTSVPLKHVANREAEVVAHNLLHPDDLRSADHDRVPAAVFTDPQIASIGLTEQQCRDRGVEYRVGRANYADVAYGWAMQDDTGFVKVLVEPDGRLLGAHILGAQAAVLVELIVTAMTFGITAPELVGKPYWIHPAIGEVVKEALIDSSPRD